MSGPTIHVLITDDPALFVIQVGDDRSEPMPRLDVFAHVRLFYDWSDHAVQSLDKQLDAVLCERWWNMEPQL